MKFEHYHAQHKKSPKTDYLLSGLTDILTDGTTLI
jgi:hypothetical protein